MPESIKFTIGIPIINPFTTNVLHHIACRSGSFPTKVQERLC